MLTGKLLIIGIIVLGVILIYMLTMRRNFKAHVDRLEAEIKASSEPSFPRTDLPLIVMSYLDRVGVGRQAISKYVTFEQTGQMWSGPDTNPIDFAAKQIISTNETEFVWRAKAYFAKSVMVIDYFVKSMGGLEVKLLGAVSLAHMVGGESIAKGEALRFLAELPLNPDAILFNTALEWTEIDSKSFKAAAGQGRARGEITFTLGDDGLIKTASALSRPYGTKSGDVKEYPWHGRFWEYQSVHGRTVPMRAEVAWHLDSGDFIYWQGKMLNWQPHAN
jgi:hypothetical protein